MTRHVGAIALAFLAGCSLAHGRDEDPRSDIGASTASDAFRGGDTGGGVVVDAGGVVVDAGDEPSADATGDARVTCPTWPRATVAPPPGERTCLDQRVPTTSGVSCTSRGAFVEVASGTDAPMRSVTIEREHLDGASRLCVSAYDDCSCRDTHCVEPGESFELVGAHTYRRLVIENDGEPVRVIVCN